MKARTRRSRWARGGFTLIEVLLAIALLIVLSGGIMGYIWNLMNGRDRLVRATDEQIAAAALFEEVETNLAATFAVDGSGGPGVEGTATSLVVRSRGVGSISGEGVNDFGDLQGCDLKFADHSLTAKRLGKNDSAYEVLVQPVGAVRFRYFDGSKWGDSFNSASAGGLPVAVEASVWFDSDITPSGSDAKDESRISGENSEDEEKPARAPDRVRVMVVPDGPAASWKSKL